MKKITPFLWYDHHAEEAANFYVSVFKNSKVTAVNRAGGHVITVNFELDGQQFIALNAGPKYKFTEATSFFISCDTQQEVDTLWEKLSDGGEKSQCGWLKDKFGLSWQVWPRALGEMMENDTPEQIARVTKAMLAMKKFDIAIIEKAYKR